MPKTQINQLASTDSAVDTIELASQYLVAELEMLHERANLQEQTVANKINFLLIVVSAVIGGLALLSGNTMLAPFYGVLLCALPLFTFLLGLSTFYQVLDLAANATFFYRRAGRIRRWFLDLEPRLLMYTPFVVSDDRPLFLPTRSILRGIESLLILLNSAMLGLASGVLIGMIAQRTSGLSLTGAVWIGAIGGVASFTLCWIWHIKKVKRYMRHREDAELKEGHIRFPAEEYSQMIQTTRSHHSGKMQTGPTDPIAKTD